MMARMRRALVLVVGIAVAGCGGDSDRPAADASTSSDAKPGADAAPADAMPARPRLVYVSDNGDSQLAVVQLGVDGTMTAMPDLDVELPAAPTAMAYGRDTRRLYVGLQSGAIATLDLDGDGAPSLQAMTTATGNPVYIGLVEDESIMVTAYFGDDEIKTHDVSGAPPHSENATLAVANEPHAAFPGPGGLVYVPHRTGDTIRWFAINGDGDPVLAGELAAEPGVGPRHIAFTPDGAFAYVVNEMGNSISSHSVGADGSLTRFETVPALAAPEPGVDTGADIHVSPDGRFVYASFRGADVLAMFAIGAGGNLTGLGTVATEARPREFDVSPDGRFVIACGQDSGFLQSYRVEDDGTLTPVERLQVSAGQLRWAIID